MKILTTLMTILFSVVIALPGYAENTKTVLLFSVSNKKVARIGAINSSDRIIHLSISNERKEKYFEKGIKPGESYFEFHDLSKLPEGEYFIILGRGKETVLKKFTVNGETIIIEGDKEMTQKLMYYIPGQGSLNPEC